MMRKLILSAVCVSLLSAAQSQTIKTPAPSPTQTLKQDFGLSSIELYYSRPGMKGRKIFGDLVPFGKVWRTGANLPTTITFGDEVIINSVKVPAGKYGMVTIPDRDSWTIIITKQLDVSSPAAYKMENDVVRVSVRPMTMKEKVESFTMQITDVKPNTCAVEMMWENTAVAFPISTDVETKVMAQINDVMNKDNRPYFNAAMYYLDNGKDLNQALAWFDKAIEQQPEAYWAYHQRANTLAKLGKKAEAKASAEKSIELATKAQNDDYVKLNEKLLAQLK